MEKPCVAYQSKIHLLFLFIVCEVLTEQESDANFYSEVLLLQGVCARGYRFQEGNYIGKGREGFQIQNVRNAASCRSKH